MCRCVTENSQGGTALSGNVEADDVDAKEENLRFSLTPDISGVWDKSLSPFEISEVEGLLTVRSGSTFQSQLNFEAAELWSEGSSRAGDRVPLQLRLRVTDSGAISKLECID